MKRLMGLNLLLLVPLAVALAAQGEAHLSEFTKILRDWRPESVMTVTPPESQEMVI